MLSGDISKSEFATSSYLCVSSSRLGIRATSLCCISCKRSSVYVRMMSRSVDALLVCALAFCASESPVVSASTAIALRTLETKPILLLLFSGI